MLVVKEKHVVRILFVCMGNICRSPTAEGVFRRVLDEVEFDDNIHIDSAGTHAYHVGRPPDSRTLQAASRRGVDLSQLRARKVEREDFANFDYVLAMDNENLSDLQCMCPPEHAHKLRLFMEFAPDYGSSEVPDPYYGAARGFEQVLDMVESASQGLIKHLMTTR